MNQKELVKVTAEKLEKPQKAVGEIVEAFLETLTEALADGETVSLVGFGKFVITEVEEKEARNPRTGETVVVPAHNMLSFKASSALKEAVK